MQYLGIMGLGVMGLGIMGGSQQFSRNQVSESSDRYPFHSEFIVNEVI